jgi:tetratricopeptide (TPR) repeat protein
MKTNTFPRRFPSCFLFLSMLLATCALVAGCTKKQEEQPPEAKTGNPEAEAIIQKYTREIEKNPGSAEAHNKRGVAYYEKGDYGLAVRDYTKAIELSPKVAEIYNNRGNALDKQGDYTGAVLDYTKAIELSPELSAAYYNRALAHFRNKDYEKAKLDADKCKELGDEVDPRFLEDLEARMKAE